MDTSSLSDLLSSVGIGAVLGFIFYFIVETVGLPEFGRIELGMPEMIVIGALLGVVFYLFGRVTQ